MNECVFMNVYLYTAHITSYLTAVYNAIEWDRTSAFEGASGCRRSVTENRNEWADDELTDTEWNICCNILFCPLSLPSIINNKKYYKIHGRMAIVYNAKQVLVEILISCVLIVRSQIYQTHSSLGLKCRCMKDCQGSILEFGPCKVLLLLVKKRCSCCHHWK